MSKQRNRFLYANVISVNLLALSAGCSFSWTSPVLPRLKQTIDNPLGRPIAATEESFVSSLINLSGAFVPFLCGFLADRIGRKRTLQIFSISNLVSYLILAFATRVELYFFARFFLGLGCGCALSIVPLYVAEIAENSNRGLLGCFLELFITVGELFTLVIGHFATIKVLCLASLIPVVIFFVTFFFFPESPYYYFMVNDKDAAEEVLKQLRRGQSVEKELEEIRDNVEDSLQKKRSFCDLIKSRPLLKALFVSVGLMFFQQFSGITPILFNMEAIFIESGSWVSPDIATIIISSVQVLFCFLTSQIVDRIGKKILLISSLFGTSICLFLLGCYFYFQFSFTWLPLVCMTFYMVFFVLGLGPICWAIMGELFPPDAKAIAAPIVTCTCMSLAFMTSALYPSFLLVFGLATTLWSFAFCNLLGIAFVAVWVPETTGKSLLEIQKHFL